MSVGVIWGKVLLDNPDKIHCGPNDPVTGNIELIYRPKGAIVRSQAGRDQSPDLYGPLKLFLTFYGRAKSKIHKSNGQWSNTYRGRAPLFSQQIKIHDGPWNCKPYECSRFPFSLNFPDGTQPMREHGDFDEDKRFHREAGVSLPPTFSTKFSSFTKTTNAFVEYRVSASINMPGIDVEVHGVEAENRIPAILYDQPRLPMSQASPPKTRRFTESALIQNEHLLPEDERPSGFRQKTKFLFSSEKYPTFLYDLNIVVPKEVYMGQPLVFEISIRPDLDRSTTTIQPELRISWLHAQFTAHTLVRGESHFLATPESDKEDSFPRLMATVLDKDVPFSKANDFTKVCQTHAGLGNVGTPFTTYNISVAYALKVEFRIAGAGTDVYHERHFPVTVLRTIDDGGQQESVGASSSAAAAVASSSTSPYMRELRNPPTPPKENALPQYDRPPEYDEVLDMTTENDVPDYHGLGKGPAT